MMNPKVSLQEFVEMSRDCSVVPVFAEVLADMTTPIGLAHRLEGGRRFMILLESADRGETFGRYSFICDDPLMILESCGESNRVFSEDGVAERDGDPLDLLRTMTAGITAPRLECLPPFLAGFVGYVGYDYVRLIEHLPNKSLALHDSPDLLMVLPRRLYAFDHLRHTVTIVVNCRVAGGDAESQYAVAVSELQEMASVVAGSQSGMASGVGRTDTAHSAGAAHSCQGPLVGRLNVADLFRKHARIRPTDQKMPECDPERFKLDVETAKRHIVAGDIIQVVLSNWTQREVACDALSVYRALRSINPSPYMFYMNFGGLQLVGSSPEMLVRLQDGEARLCPIAGTRQRGRTPDEDERLKAELLADQKENSEHVMLVDLGRNDIGRVCRPGTVRVDRYMGVDKYSHVMHIVSSVRGEARDGVDQFDVFRSAFPAGTVTGAPKVRAMEIIEDSEAVRRGIYAGAVGYFSARGDMDMCIAIRTITILGGIATIRAGAGIVADSIPKAEYEETCRKAEAMLRALRLAESCEYGGVAS